MPADLGFDVPDEQLDKLWGSLSSPQQRELLSVSRKRLFEEIRKRYCSRCYGLFALRSVLSAGLRSVALLVPCQ